MTKVDFTLTGCANGHPVRIEGMGAASPQRVRISLTAVEAPFTFDAGLAHFAGLDALLAVAAWLVTPHDEPIVARCRADLLGEGGAEIGAIAAVATVTCLCSRLSSSAQLSEAHVAFEPGERLTTIGARTITAVSQGGGIAMFAASTIATSRGREITVLASALLVGASSGRRQSLAVPPTATAAGAATIRFGSR